MSALANFHVIFMYNPSVFIYLVAELTSISNIYGLMVGLDTFSDSTLTYTTGITISLAVFTWFYTSLAGLPVSMVTDKFQAGLMFSLVFILLIVACSNPENQVTKEEFAVASNWTADGLTAAVTLFTAMILNVHMKNSQCKGVCELSRKDAVCKATPEQISS